MYKWVERRVFNLVGKEKTAVVIKDGQSTVNESYPSANPHYLLWVTACFLEDYLGKRFLKLRYKRHEGSDP